MIKLFLEKLTLSRVLSLFLLIGTFVLDLTLSVGVAFGTLYILSIYIVSRQGKRTVIIFASLAVLLSLIKLFVWDSPDFSEEVVINRLLSIVVMVFVATLAVHRCLLLEVMDKKKNAYLEELEEMLFMTSHRVRKPVVTFMGLLNLWNDKKSLTDEELQAYLSQLSASATELDAFTRELTTYIHEAGAKKKTDQFRPGAFSFRQVMQ